PAMTAVASARPTRRVRLLWGLLTVVMIILYILFNGFSASAQERSKWIGYPGDFEVWLSNKVQNPRTERGTFFPPFWRLDNHYILVDFRKQVDLPADDNVELKAEGKYNCKVDGKM